MPGQRVRQTMAAAAALIILTGCDSPPVEPPPTGTTTTNPTSTTLRYGAPPVALPLDAARFREDACLSLAPDQRDALNLEVNPDSQVKSMCPFTVRGGSAKIEGYIDFAASGLARLYRANASGSYRGWEPFEIDGYPAVRLLPKERGCHVVVGLSDQTTADIFLEDEGTRSAEEQCVSAAGIATEVLATVRAAG
ncbi:DUF3558 family protein [Actinokineospora fastidiosa]|uniref:DUF3558 domain-containing protein n=1 Tax=Actinokineospora fastidiosa TaxID=1816 RepID=A0A918GKC0_9PSEU|nr:DUF3558 family protein [Actinokineospora fastidiosa]GGS42810.1 hypothetical protein GCM10010171_42300 [Actinokineospora fastidiosa]